MILSIGRALKVAFRIFRKLVFGLRSARAWAVQFLVWFPSSHGRGGQSSGRIRKEGKRVLLPLFTMAGCEYSDGHVVWREVL